MVVQNCLKLLEELSEIEARIEACREALGSEESELFEELLIQTYAQSRGK